MSSLIPRIVWTALVLMLGWTGTAGSAMTQEATPAIDGFPVTPDPALCDVEPRTIEDIEQLIQAAQAATPFAPVTDDFTPPMGEPADPEVVSAVARDTIVRSACFHGNDYLRGFALQTDAFVASQFAQLPPTPEDLAFFADPEPAPPENRLTLLGMREVVVLADGRVGAYLDRQYPGGLRETMYVVMAEIDGRWRLDDVLFSAPLTEAQDAAAATPAVASGVTVYPPDDAIHGATLGEWNARWWQWAVSFPSELDPGLSGAGDTRGDPCGYGQSGPVFFLPSAATPLVSCIIPSDRAIFVPADAVVCSTVEPPPFFGRNEAELRACAEEWIEGTTSVTVAIDGQPLDLAFENYRATSPLFTLYLPEDNWYEVPAGVAHAVAGGHNVILAPLPEGEYEITTRLDATGMPGPFVATYHITVESPTVIDPNAPFDDGTPVATPAG